MRNPRWVPPLALTAVGVALDRRLASLDRRLILERLSETVDTDFTWMQFAKKDVLVAYINDVMARPT